MLRATSLLVDRNHAVVRVRAESGEWQVRIKNLPTFESMMTQVADPRNAPEILALRESIRAWRFYDHFRTDVDAPARSSQIGTRTLVLGHDGSDLAAAIQTIAEIGDVAALQATIEDAFPKSRLDVTSQSGRFTLGMEQHGLLRTLGAAELSDGTLRYILWIAALLTPRPPELMVLNEPETSLHPDLLGALARLIARAAKSVQLVVVTHSPVLIAELQKESSSHFLSLEKSFGETRLAGIKEFDLPPWAWPER